MLSPHKKLAFCLAVVSCTPVTALEAQTAPAATRAASQTVAGASPATSEPRLQQRYPRYKIQNQDTLLITFPLSPELNQTVTVQPDGYVNMQTAGSVHIQGMTVPEVVDALKKAYIGILNNPIINVDLEDYQKPFFTVSGQVGKPGQYDLRTDITVAEAIAVAGDWFEVEKLNLKDVLNGKNPNEDPTLRAGDMVFVPEKFIANFRKYVPYSLNAGSYVPIP
jgi:polysaccharide export outer membrane protein